MSKKEELIAICPYMFRYMKNPTEKDYIQALKSGYDFYEMFKHMKNPTKKMIYAALECDGRIIKKIKNPDEIMINIALRTYPRYFLKLKNPTLKQKKILLKFNGNYYHKLSKEDKENKELLRIAVASHPILIKELKITDPDLIMIGLTTNGYNIRYVENPTDRMIEVAFKSNEYCIQYLPKNKIKPYMIHEFIYKKDDYHSILKEYKIQIPDIYRPYIISTNPEWAFMYLPKCTKVELEKIIDNLKSIDSCIMDNLHLIKDDYLLKKIYKKATDHEFKEIIKMHKNWKDDASLIFDYIKDKK